MSDESLRISEPRTRAFRGAHTSPVHAVAMNQSSNRLVSVGSDGAVVFWDLKSSAYCTKTCTPHVSNRSVAISPDGGYVAVASFTPDILLWGPDDHDLDVEPIRLIGHAHAVRFVAFHPRHGFLVSCDEHDPVISIWNAKTCVRVSETRCPFLVRSIAFHPFENSAVVTLSESQPFLGGFVAIVRFTEEGDIFEVSKPVCVHVNWIDSVLFSHDARSIFVAGSMGALKQISFPELQVMRTFDLPAHFSDAIALSADGRILVVGGDKSLIYFYDVATGNMLSELGTFHGNIESFSVSPDARYLAVNGCRFGSPLPADSLRGKEGFPFSPDQRQQIFEHNRDGDLTPSILDFGTANFGAGTLAPLIPDITI